MTSWVQRFGSNEVKVVKLTDNKAYLRVTNAASVDDDVVNKSYLDGRVTAINTKILSVQTLVAGTLNYPNSYYVLSSETYSAINGDLGVGDSNMNVTLTDNTIELDIMNDNNPGNNNTIRMYKSIQGAIKAAYKAHIDTGHEAVADANDYIIDYQVPRIILLSGVHNVSQTINIPNYYYSTGTPSQPFDVEIMGESNTIDTIINFNPSYSSDESSSNTWIDGFRSYGVETSSVSDDNLTATDQYSISQSARENSIKFRNLSIHGAKWGIYALCNYLSVEDCKFYNCGWSGDIGTYDGNANFFYGSDSSTSTEPSSLTDDGDNTLTGIDGSDYYIVDGGAIFFNSRIIDDSINGNAVNYNANNITNLQDDSNVHAYKNRKNNSIKNNIFNYNNEGIHVLHSMNMEISNNKFCKNMGKCITNKYSYKTLIDNNFIESCFNTSIMLLNCFKSSIMHNNIYDVWNCGICCITSSHTLIQNNNLTDINERSYNGYGNGLSGGSVDGYGETNGNNLIGDGSVIIKGKTSENANHWKDSLTSTSGIFGLLHRDATVTLSNANHTVNACIMNNNTLVRGGRGTNSYTVAIALIQYNSNDIDLPIIINNFNGNTPISYETGTETIDTTESTLIDVQGFNYGDANNVYLIVNNCLSFLYKATIENTGRDFTDNAFGTFSSNILDVADRIVLNDNNIQPV